MLAVLLFALPWLFLSEPSAAQPVCEPKDFELIGVRFRRVTDRTARVTGEIRSECSVPGGPRLRVVFRAPDGTVSDVSYRTPADTRNMAPGETIPFDYPVAATAGSENGSIVVADVRRW